MAVSARLPWYVSAGYIVGLSGVLFGQRLFAHIGGVSSFFTLVGVALMLCATALRIAGFWRTSGDQRHIEKLTLLTYLGALLAMAIYALTTKWGLDLLGYAEAAPDEVKRLVVPLQVTWAIILTCSILPLMLLELGQAEVPLIIKVCLVLTPLAPILIILAAGVAVFSGSHRKKRQGFEEGAVDSLRISELATSGLTIALALSFLMVTCEIANERNIKKDVSYFKTSEAGSATVNIVNSLSKPLQVLLFYPEVNEVKEEVMAYFQELARKTQKIEVKAHDHKAERALAEKYKVSSDGTIVMIRGDKHEKFNVSHKIRRARGKALRTLDATVQKTLMKVVRAKRIAYFTTGHGELNDPKSAGVLSPAAAIRNQVSKLKQLLRLLNYQSKNLSAFDLASEVPDDATMLIALAPQRSFTEQEESIIDTYLSAGGAMLLTLDPNGHAELGKTLVGRLGVRYINTPLADDKEFVPQRHNKADHAFMKTNQFSSHASVTTLSRQGAAAGILLIRPGYLEPAPFHSQGKPKRTFVVRSMNSSFADANQNFVHDKSEPRKRYNIAVAVEDLESKKDSEGGEVPAREGMRAMVLADAEIFTDLVLGNVPLLQNLLYDSFNWLGGEEQFQGTTESEKDKRIEHTKSEDSIRFWASSAGVPILVLVIGGLLIRRRRS